MDVHSRDQRSFNMSRIRSKDTKPEMIVRSFCHNLGYRFRLHRKDLPGTPDLVFPKYRIALFVHGCFWHSHHCKWGKVKPKTRQNFWEKKRTRTIERDVENFRLLKDRQWSPYVIWECETKDIDLLTEEIMKIFGG